MAEPAQPPDLITMGRAGVEIYPRHTGVALARVDDSGKFRESAAPVAADTRAHLTGVREPRARAEELPTHGPPSGREWEQTIRRTADSGGVPDGENR